MSQHRVLITRKKKQWWYINLLHGQGIFHIDNIICFKRIRYTKKKVVVQLTISGSIEGETSRVEFEGIGEDLDMLPTTIDEIADDIDSWTCMNCGAALTAENVESLKRRQAVECRYCQHIMTIDLYV